MALVPREIHLDTPEYERSWELRREVLLDPFRIDHAQAQSDDEVALHFAILEKNRCVACLLLVAQDPHVVKMRQVAVLEGQQRRGLGRTLVTFAENIARDHAFTQMIAHARESALPFYQALGYETVGAPFEEVGIPHRMVFKDLMVQKTVV